MKKQKIIHFLCYETNLLVCWRCILSINVWCEMKDFNLEVLYYVWKNSPLFVQVFFCHFFITKYVNFYRKKTKIFCSLCNHMLTTFTVKKIKLKNLNLRLNWNFVVVYFCVIVIFFYKKKCKRQTRKDENYTQNVDEEKFQLIYSLGRFFLCVCLAWFLWWMNEQEL